MVLLTAGGFGFAVLHGQDVQNVKVGEVTFYPRGGTAPVNQDELKSVQAHQSQVEQRLDDLERQAQQKSTTNQGRANGTVALIAGTWADGYGYVYGIQQFGNQVTLSVGINNPYGPPGLVGYGNGVVAGAIGSFTCFDAFGRNIGTMQFTMASPTSAGVHFRYTPQGGYDAPVTRVA